MGRGFFLSSAFFVLALSAAPLAADVLTAEGISGDIDKNRRGPSLSVDTRSDGTGAKILADAYTPRDEFSKYPLRFDFYINRHLFSSQYRSPTLPGPVGIDVGPEVATPPFNYAVVVTLLHPNHLYTTAIEGAVFSSELIATLDCTLTVESSETDESDEFNGDVFTASEVTTLQAGNNSLSVAFDASNESGDRDVNVAATISIQAGEESTGSITIVEEGAQPIQVTGTATTDTSTGKLTTFTINSEDGLTTLTCG